MNDPDLTPDDPKLTAYALGELEGDDRAAVEAAVRADPVLRATVDEIRATALQIEAALAAEAERPLETFTADDAPLESGGVGARDVDDRPLVYGGARRKGRLLQFPQFYYVVGGLAAASLAIFVALRRDEFAAREQARAEALRVAMEKRAAEARAASAASQPGVVVTLPSTSATAANEEPRTTEKAGAPATEAAPVRIAMAPENLALLQQVQAPGGTESATLGTGALSNRTAEPNAGADAATRGPADNGAVATGGERRFASGGTKELFPEQQRMFVAPATGAAPATGYAKTPTQETEVVTLDTFVVVGDRTGYSAASSMAQRTSYDPFAEDREYRPKPPAGARFGRSPAGEVRDNEFQRAVFQPLSTFAVDSDAASYANVRRMISRRELPPREAVKIEELLNYFPYRYPTPAPARPLSVMAKLFREDGAPPFAAALEVAEAPWAPKHRLVRIGLKGREIPEGERPGARLVFLIDVSASMNEAGRLPLVKESMRLLLEKLRADDRVAIVTYGGKSGLVLASTPVSRRRDIVAAIDALTPSDAGAGTAGIRMAYEVARENFAEDGINRVILCTDGDFSLGVGSESELLRLVQEKAGSGVFLTVLGFGMGGGSYKDEMLEKLAERGNGNFGYIDSRREAQKVLVEQVSSTLVTIAKDVKVQVEFNPAKVSSYRLIGYENRLLRKEDFNADDVDAGEIGAGHTVTALYEIVPVGVETPAVSAAPASEHLKYVTYASDDALSSRLAMPMQAPSNELLTVTVRYKKPDDIFPRKAEFPLTDGGARFANASADFRFAAAVAQFGMILRKSQHKGMATMGDVIAWAAAAAANPADDPGGYRGAFIDLARQAQELLRSE